MVYKSRSSTKPTFGYTFLSHKSSIILSVSSGLNRHLAETFLSHKSAKGAHYAGFLQAAISEPCLSFHHPTNTKWSGCLVDCIKHPERQLHDFTKTTEQSPYLYPPPKVRADSHITSYTAPDRLAHHPAKAPDADAGRWPCRCCQQSRSAFRR